MVIFNSYVKLPEGSLLEQLLLLNSIPINYGNYGLNPSPSQASPHGGGRDARRRGASKRFKLSATKTYHTIILYAQIHTLMTHIHSCIYIYMYNMCIYICTFIHIHIDARRHLLSLQISSRQSPGDWRQTLRRLRQRGRRTGWFAPGVARGMV